MAERSGEKRPTKREVLIDQVSKQLDQVRDQLRDETLAHGDDSRIRQGVIAQVQAVKEALFINIPKGKKPSLSNVSVDLSVTPGAEQVALRMIDFGQQEITPPTPFNSRADQRVESLTRERFNPTKIKGLWVHRTQVFSSAEVYKGELVTKAPVSTTYELVGRNRLPQPQRMGVLTQLPTSRALSA